MSLDVLNRYTTNTAHVKHKPQPPSLGWTPHSHRSPRPQSLSAAIISPSCIYLLHSISRCPVPAASALLHTYLLQENIGIYFLDTICRSIFGDLLASMKLERIKCIFPMSASWLSSELCTAKTAAVNSLYFILWF